MAQQPPEFLRPTGAQERTWDVRPSVTATRFQVRRIDRLIRRLFGLEKGRAFVLRQLPRHSRGVEIGVHKGDFSEELLRKVKPIELHLVDPWKYEESAEYRNAWYGGKVRGGQTEMDQRYQSVCRRFKHFIRDHRVIIHRTTSTEALKGFGDAYFDWIYIDGNHRYEFVRDDLRLSCAKIKPGGFIAGDDYGDEGWWQGGVTKAFDEFVQRQKPDRFYISGGQFVLQK